MYRVTGPNTGSNPGGGRIQKKMKSSIKSYYTKTHMQTNKPAHHSSLVSSLLIWGPSQPILTVTTVSNTGETGDIYAMVEKALFSGSGTFGHTKYQVK